jgi:small subunit ribosomal protein S5
MVNDRPQRNRFRREGPRDEFESKLLDLARVSHTRAGGKKMRFRALVVSGDKKGKVGFGLGKGGDVALAIEKATRLSKKSMIEIPVVNETIPHEVQAKVGAAEILLRPQRKGRGLVAGGTVRLVCQLAGIRNISSKVLGGTGNKINNVRATMEALKKLKVKK